MTKINALDYGETPGGAAWNLRKLFRTIDAVTQCNVISATTTAQPASPAQGDLYIIPSGKTGALWSTFATGSLAQYRTNEESVATWIEITPQEGWQAWARDTNTPLVYIGTSWVALADVASVMAFGAKGNAVVGSTGVTTATDATFTDAAAAWTAADIGKEIHIVGAGTAGAVHSTTIASINSATSIELTAVAVTTVASNAEYVYGTNDSTAIQAAIATGKTVSIPDAAFLVDADVLTMATAGQVMIGSPNGVTENEYRGARLVTYDITGKVINITAHGCLIQHVAIYSIGDPTSLYGFYANNTSEASGNNQDDVDFTLYDCHGYHMTTFCYVKGRALTAIDNSFAGGTGTDVMFEREFPTSNVGAGTYHDVPYGFRKDQIRGNLTHGNTNFLKVVGTNRIYYRAIIAHNMNDIGGRLFEGAGADLIFAGNFTKHSSSVIYYFDAACESVQFLGETALGTPSDLAESPAYCAQFTAAATDIRVTGGVFGDSDGAAFHFEGNVSSLNINGACFKNWGQDATGQDSAILFASGISVTNSCVNGCTFKEGAGSDNPIYADGATLTRFKALGNVWDTAEGAFVQGAYTNGGGNNIEGEADGVWQTLARSGEAVALTGTTAETTLASVTLNGGRMGPKGEIRVRTLWSVGANNANNKFCRTKLGSTTFHAANLTSQLSAQMERSIWNRNNAASQVAWVETTANSFGPTTVACDTGTEDTTGDLTIAITGQLGSSGDTLTLEAYSIEVCSNR